MSLENIKFYLKSSFDMKRWLQNIKKEINFLILYDSLKIQIFSKN